MWQNQDLLNVYILYFQTDQWFQMIMVDCCCCCCGVNVCLMRGTEETCASRTIGVSPSNGQKRVHSPSPPPPPLGLCGCCLVLYCLTKVTLVPSTLRSLQGLLDDQKYLLCTLLYFNSLLNSKLYFHLLSREAYYVALKMRLPPKFYLLFYKSLWFICIGSRVINQIKMFTTLGPPIQGTRSKKSAFPRIPLQSSNQNPISFLDRECVNYGPPTNRNESNDQKRVIKLLEFIKISKEPKLVRILNV